VSNLANLDAQRRVRGLHRVVRQRNKVGGLIIAWIKAQWVKGW